MNVAAMRPYISLGNVVATSVVSNLMNTLPWNPASKTITDVPASPWVGNNDITSPLAFATNVVAAAEVNMPRANSASVILTSPSFKSIRHFAEYHLSRILSSILADLKLAQGC